MRSWRRRVHAPEVPKARIDGLQVRELKAISGLVDGKVVGHRLADARAQPRRLITDAIFDKGRMMVRENAE
jgi:hypothetical protein